MDRSYCPLFTWLWAQILLSITDTRISPSLGLWTQCCLKLTSGHFHKGWLVLCDFPPSTAVELEGDLASSVHTDAPDPSAVPAALINAGCVALQGRKPYALESFPSTGRSSFRLGEPVPICQFPQVTVLVLPRVTRK